MEVKTPPQWECGNELMLLRQASEYSTRPGHYYFLCPAGLKHRNLLFWYDEYNVDCVSGNNEPSSKNETSSNCSQNTTSLDSNRMHRHTHTFHGSSSAQSGTLKNTDTVDSQQHVQTKPVMASTTAGIQKDSVEHTPLSVEHVCCCFWCVCTLLCVMIFFMLVIVISM